MKKVSCVIIIFAMLFLLTACNNNSPEKTVIKLCDSIKSFDLLAIKDCLNDPEESFNSGSSMDLSELESNNMLASYYSNLKKWASNINCKIVNTETANETATVTANIKFKDASQIMAIAMANYISQGIALSLTGATEETMATVFAGCIDDAVKNNDVQQTEKNIVFTLVKNGSEWKIDKMPEEMLDVLTANSLSMFSKFNQSTTGSNSANQHQETAPYTSSNTYETLSDFESNDYYDVLYGDVYSNKYYTYLVFAVQAKKDGKASATIYFFDEEGNVVEKKDDTITLCAGYINYFSVYFDNEVPANTYDATVKVRELSFSEDERQAVVMEKYNVSNDYLYITVKQTGEVIDYFDKYKILFLKDDRIIGTEDGYLHSDAANLGSKGSTDVAKISLYDTDFDDFLFIYEPDA